jgi:hypothetical protein
MKRITTINSGRNIFLTLFICFLAFNNKAQVIFQKTFGGSGADYAYDAHRAPTGGYVFGGVSSSFPLVGSVSSYVVKTDNNWDTLWTASFIGTGGNCEQQYVNDLCPLADGGVVAVGGKAVCGDTMVGGNMVRLDANGNVLWAKYSGKYADPYPVMQSNDGNIIVGGYETDGGFNSVKDAFLMKLDLVSGDTLWSKRYGGASGDEWFYHILQTPDNGYLSAGFTTSFGQGNRDIYLVKTDAAGNLQWSKAYGTANYECAFGHSLQPTSDGGYILAGQSDNGAQSTHGVFLMKIDAAGNMSWAKYFDGKDGHGVKQTSDGGYVITGRSTTGVQLIKTDANGNILWSKVYTGGTSEKGLILELATDGGFVLGGQGAFSGNTELYMIKTDSLGNSGCNESNAGVTSSVAAFITVTPATQVSFGAKTVSYPVLFQRGGSANSLCTTMGIAESVKTNGINLSPNPAKNSVTIRSETELGMITILNSLGETIYKEKIYSTRIEIDLSGKASGIYFIQTASEHIKFIKE